MLAGEVMYHSPSLRDTMVISPGEAAAHGV